MSATSFRRLLPGVIAAGLGGVVIAGTTLREWGHVPYGYGVVAVAFGAGWVAAQAVRGAVWRAGASVGAAGIVLASGLVAVTGFGTSPPQWETGEQLDGQWTTRTGDLITSGGTARHVDTGDVVWEHDDPEAFTMLVDTELVVLGTSDGSIGVDPATGRQLWQSPVEGRGIAHDGDTLVIAHTPPEENQEAVALDVATGETRWRQEGRPVMECDLGPVDLRSPAREQSHVLLIGDEENENDAALLDLADGNTTIAEVNCFLSARVVDAVLIEGDEETLTGRSVSEGEELWSASAPEPWHIIGDGPTVFTPVDSSITAIDVATGQTRQADPPAGTRDIRMTEMVQRATEVWALLVVDSTFAMWNPGTDKLVEIPEAASLRVEGSDASSGWITLSGTTRDFTGQESPQCWAISQDGRLSEPIPERHCLVAEGLLQTNRGVHPIA